MKISFIGAGNVATHLAKALFSKGHQILSVHTRSEESAIDFSNQFQCLIADRLSSIPKSEIYIFSIKDDALPIVLNEFSLLDREGLCVHTAGSIPLSVFPKEIKNFGVLYPLQTISKDRELSFENVPFFIEANTPCNLEKIKALARDLSRQVIQTDSQTREKLHLAAVFANNFTNHCFTIATQLLHEANLPSELLLPIAHETFEKIKEMSPIQAQTGPAVRYDQTVMSKQLKLLDNKTHAISIYKSISESIHHYAIQTNKKITNNTNTMINYDLKKIKALAFDVDGVLSANNVILASNGQPDRTANIKDGYALQLAVKCGLNLAIITGGKSEAVRTRYVNLGLQNVFMGVAVKIVCFKDWMEESGLKPEEVLYMGDDIPDFEVMRECGLPCCPADAAQEIKEISTYVSQFNGGFGCVRDVVEQVLRAQGKWMSNAEAFGW